MWPMLGGMTRYRFGVFFSVHGERSEQDKIAGGDFDGDQRQVIGWQKLVQMVTPCAVTRGTVPKPPSGRHRHRLEEPSGEGTAALIRGMP